MPWPEFLKLLHSCWRESTGLANWASHTLARLDCVRTPAMTELPKWEPPDLYALAFGRAKEGKPRKEGKGPLPVVEAQYGGDFWAGAKIAAATLLRKVARKYAAERGKVIWRRDRRTPEFLYPYPFPVHQQAWVPYYNETGRPCVNLALPGGRVAVRLRGGPEFSRQLAAFRLLVDGEAKQLELSLCRQRAGASHRREDAQRLPGGGHRESYRVMVRIACQVPVWSVPPEGLTAALRTGGDPFLTLAVADQPPWVLHAPWVRHWVAEHRKFLDAFADDLKYEKRWPSSKRRGLNRYRERRCDKHARRMKSFLQQTAAQVVGHAVRRKVARIRYDDADRSFVGEFPWFALAERFRQKCDEAGIVLESAASGAAVGTEEMPEANAEVDG